MIGIVMTSMTIQSLCYDDDERNNSKVHDMVSFPLPEKKSGIVYVFVLDNRVQQWKFTWVSDLCTPYPAYF